MKRFIFLSMVFVLLLAVVPGALAAPPGPGGPYKSAFSVMNIDPSMLAASCTFSLYNSSGTAVFTSSPTNVNYGDSMYVYMGDPAYSGIAKGSYSGVVNCDKQVAAVVSQDDANSGAAFNGIDSPTTTWYAPGIYNNYYQYYSNIVVQNATGSPVDIRVDIYAPGNAVAIKTQTATAVPGYASANFEQTGLPELITNVPYSAKITATGNVAPIVDIYGLGKVKYQLYSYNPFSAGATKFYTPVIMNNYYGNYSAIAVQNVGSSPADVTITYATGQTWSGTIPVNSSESRYTPIDGVPDGSLTAATVESTNGQPIVVVVNESNNYNRAATYSGFSSGSLNARAPFVMRRYSTYNTSVVCENIGEAPATMTLQYSGIAGSNVSDHSIAVYETYMFYQPIDPLIPDGFLGSATITSTQNLVCIVNEDANENPYRTMKKDFQHAYNAIN
jgi:hypothetical protein